jgi:AmmeMemoRadiSam system protein B
VPILVGNTSPRAEADYGQLLAPYFTAPGAVVVASSDFCHWGTRFRYTYYEPTAAETQGTNLKAGVRLRQGDRAIHESIAAVDARCMAAVETGRHKAFLDVLQATGNTVCGRHPIGVVMAALEAVDEEAGGGGTDGAKARFKFVQYDRSSLVESVGESSVSYCSGYAVY